MKRRLIVAGALAVLALIATACLPTPYDFTGDHIADYGWMDDTGSFYIVGDPDPIFTPETVTQAHNPIPVSGDWDGDTWTEPAVVSAETGVWETPDGTFTYAPADLDPAFDPADIQSSGSQWIPVPANWDTTDSAWEPAWYREDDATWFIQGQAPIQFGTGANGVTPDDWPTPPADDLAWDIPTPLDFDNDGAADIAVYRPLDGTYRTQDEGVIGTVGLGLPVAADYDGDRAADPAIYQFFPAGWVIDGTPFLGQTDPFDFSIPAAADYDGDKKADPTLFDWYGGTFVPVNAPPVAAPDAIRSSPSGTPWWQEANIIRLTFLIADCIDIEEPNCPSGITPPPR